MLDLLIKNSLVILLAVSLVTLHVVFDLFPNLSFLGVGVLTRSDWICLLDILIQLFDPMLSCQCVKVLDLLLSHHFVSFLPLDFEFSINDSMIRAHHRVLHELRVRWGVDLFSNAVRMVCHTLISFLLLGYLLLVVRAKNSDRCRARYILNMID